MTNEPAVGRPPFAGHRIKDFYRDANVFVSGGSGYLGKVIVEKLLRTCTGVRRVYVLMRAKRGRSPPERLRHMLAEADVFRVLRDTQPELLAKVHCLEGDMGAERLGLSEADVRRFCGEINVVVHAAATVRFNEPMRVALNLNVLGTRRLLELCAQCVDLRSIVHVSTAYVNGDHFVVDEHVYPPEFPVDLDYLIENLGTWPEAIALKVSEHVQGSFVNSYITTKRLSEQLIEARYAHLPICIVRPSIIIPTYREPFSGWLDSIVGPIFVMLMAMTGSMKYFKAKRNVTMDVVPLDYVSNMILSAAWYNIAVVGDGGRQRVRVFNCTSGSLQPANAGVITDTAIWMCRKYPSMKTIMYPDLEHSENMAKVFWLSLVYHVGPALLADCVSRLQGKQAKALKLLRYAHEMVLLGRYFVNHEWQYGVANVRHLIDTCATTVDGATDFQCDVRNIDYDEMSYITAMGTRKYLLRDERDTLPRARRRLRWLYALKLANHCVQAAVAYIVVRFVLRRLAILS